MADQLVQVISRSHHERLLEAMWKLRVTGNLCDITVQVDFQGELEEFEAHQIVLAASSGYFKSLLLTGKEMKKVFLNNISPNLFLKFLQYVYCGNIEVEKSCLSKIIDMAKQLDCQDLQEACGTKSLDHDYGMNQKSKIWMKVKRERSKKAVKKAVDPRKPIRITLRSVAADWERKKVLQTRRSSRLKGRHDVHTGKKKEDCTANSQPENLSQDKAEATLEEPSQDVEVGETESDAADQILPKENVFTASGSVSPFAFIPDVAEDDVQEFDFLPAETVEKTDEAQEESKAGSMIKFECEQCTRSFRYEKSYLKHIRVSHGIKSDTTYRCEICQQTFANRSNLTIHERHVHNDERLFICGVCSKTFKRKKDVTRHMRQVHEGGTPRHTCSICGKSLSSKTALNLHSRTHTGDKPYSCTECGTRFSQSSALKTHQRIHTGEKPFACDMCDARFTQNHMLAYHKRSHTGERPYMCENCGKSFASKEYLKHHARIHSGLKPFKCENCGRAFAQRNSLHQHMKIHTGERPYPCMDCKKQFTQLNALQRHQRIHTGEKPYMCSLCGRTFTDKSTVRRHALSRVNGGHTTEMRQHGLDSTLKSFNKRENAPTHDKNTPWKNYLVVLPNNVEKKTKTSTLKKSRSALKSEKHQAQEKQSLAETEKIAEPVTISGEWPSTGTITVVRHATLGNLTVIQTEVTPGTQLQPIVTADGAGVISLDGSTVGIPVAVPYPIPISVAHSISDSASLTGAVTLCEPATVSDAVLAPTASSITTVTDSILSAPVEVTLSEPEAAQLVEESVQPQDSDSQQETTDQEDPQTIKSI